MNEEDPLKARARGRRDRAAVADANRRVSRALTRTNARSYLNLLLDGGHGQRARARVHGARAAPDRDSRCEAARQRLPRGSPERRALDQVLPLQPARAARTSASSSKALTAISQPIRVDKQVVERRPACRSRRFAAAVAVAVSLMFVTVLLAAGALALEREREHVRAAGARAGLAHRAAGGEGAVRGRRLRSP